jgi:prepilin-type N-terminal cleavage/methylation domain-containing protein
MSRRRGRFSGFTLIELMIVVMIIALIATLVAPRFAQSQRRASEAALDANLHSLRNAIELFMAEHGGNFPGNHGSSTFEQQLTTYTNFEGAHAVTYSPTFSFGPYIRKVPEQPVGDNVTATGVKIVTSTPTAEDNSGGIGWIYNKNTGEVWANASGYFDH